ncbi:hypothetical protein [Candidatus Poriferisodalis sp.]|uniref:hypothetical protein n=1 Tax=Candidatus Poriferisodalis sp. TaxID=3101277 RepID=UPI003B019004
MSIINFQEVAVRLTASRLESYLQASDGEIEAAVRLYDWNANAAGALHEDLGRLEVIFRNTVDNALSAYGTAAGWPDVWYRQTRLFPGRHARRAREDIAAARQRATRRGRRAEVRGRVIAELNFGFWRYLCEPPYLTSLWVPAVASAFPLHPSARHPEQVRADVADRMQRLHFLRNRIAHHEPIHRRDLSRDHGQLLELVGWMCSESRYWIAATSRTPQVIAARPEVANGEAGR